MMKYLVVKINQKLCSINGIIQFNTTVQQAVCHELKAKLLKTKGNEKIENLKKWTI
jgi:hypothetical protein